MADQIDWDELARVVGLRIPSTKPLPSDYPDDWTPLKNAVRFVVSWGDSGILIERKDKPLLDYADACRLSKQADYPYRAVSSSARPEETASLYGRRGLAMLKADLARLYECQDN